MRLNASNDFKRQLAESISTTDTTIELNNVTGVPSVPFVLVLSTGEIVKVTDRDGTILTVERGYEDTTPREASEGTDVENVLTAGMYDSLADKDYVDEEISKIDFDTSDLATKEEVNNHINDKDNPHKVTKAQVGLDKVDNVKQASESEFDGHVSNSDIHVTASDKQAWNNPKAEDVLLKSSDFSANNVEGGMQELFTSVSDGKNTIGGAITDVDDSVVIPTEPSFNDLATAIGEISTGKKWASGTSVTSNTATVEVDGLDFKPSLVLAVAKANGTGDSIFTLFSEDLILYESDWKGFTMDVLNNTPAFTGNQATSSGFVMTFQNIPRFQNVDSDWIAFE